MLWGSGQPGELSGALPLPLGAQPMLSGRCDEGAWARVNSSRTGAAREVVLPESEESAVDCRKSRRASWDAIVND